MNNENLNQLVLDKMSKTCRCKSVTRAAIKESIKNSADTYEKVKEYTGAGSGLCKGKGCSYIIKQLIEESK